jgi:hypothetical protein
MGFLEPAEVAAIVGAKLMTLSNWRAARKGPPFTKVHGNKVVYPVKGLERWLAERTVKPEQPPTLVHSRRARRGSARP